MLLKPHARPAVGGPVRRKTFVGAPKPAVRQGTQYGPAKLLAGQGASGAAQKVALINTSGSHENGKLRKPNS
jgi:hypothetical protein